MDPTAFPDFPLSPALLQGVDALGYAAPTPVQAAALPPILDGRDVIAQAPTGSGKTAAFGLGLLHRLDAGAGETQALVLCPTRELADQVGRQLRKLAVAIPNLKVSVLCGGIPLGPQLASLTHAPHVVVGTPGRILELAQQRALELKTLRTLVLDEADRMLDMGFEPPIREIVKRTPATRQTLLFSATMPDAIRTLAASLLRDPADVRVEGAAHAPAIEHLFVEADPARRSQQLAALLLRHRPASAVVFCNTRAEVDEVAGSLVHHGFGAMALHGDMEQRDREETLLQFANGSCAVLVASDVAARGLDVEDIGAVVNYELPHDADTWQHRVGRTARAGRGGLSLNLVGPRERARADLVAERLGAPLKWEAIDPLAGKAQGVAPAAMRTLRIDAGKQDKLRPGDIVGALTGEAGLHKDAVGKIAVYATRSYVAIARGKAQATLEKLRAGKVKGRRFRVHLL